MARALTVEIIGDDSRLRRTLQETQGHLGTFGDRAREMGTKLTGFGRNITMGVTLPLVAFGKTAIDASSDANESLNKSRVVFGQHSGAIEKWASSAATNLGQSRRQALDAAGAFGNLFTQLGITGGQAANMSMTITGLASDFASFHNADPSEVIEALGAAFRGEYDSVQRFVPTITAAAVEQKAMQMGLAGTTKELDAQDKALATYQLLLEGAGPAMGDFARTSDGAANAQRILTARTEDARAAFGDALMPVWTRILEIGTKLLEMFNRLPEPIKTGILVVGAFAAVLGPIVWIVGGLITAFGVMAPVLGTVAGAFSFLLGPVGLVAIAVGALAFLVITNWGTISSATGDMARAVGDWFGQIGGHIGNVVGWFGALPQRIADALAASREWLVTRGWELALGFLTGAIRFAVNMFQWWGDLPRAIWNVLGNVGSWLTGRGAEIVQGFLQGVWERAVSVFEWFGGLPGAISNILSNIGAWLGERGQAALIGFLTGVLSYAAPVYNFFTDLPGTISRILGNIQDWLTERGAAALQGFFSGVVDRAQQVWRFFGDLPGNIARMLGNIGGWLFNKGVEALTGLWNGAVSRYNGIMAFWGGIPRAISDVLAHIGTWLYNRGVEAVNGFINGIRSGAGAIAGWVGRVFNPFGDGWGVTAPPGAVVGGGAIAGSGARAILDYFARTGVAGRASSVNRPGARTASGNVSYHDLGRAVDFVGPNLMAIFNSFLPIAGQLKELIYSGAPFSIKNGQRVGRYAINDHWGHVHAAFGSGAYFPSQTTIGASTFAERGPELVSPVSMMAETFQRVLNSHSAQTIVLNARLFLGTKDITDMVRVELDSRDREATRLLVAGLR